MLRCGVAQRDGNVEFVEGTAVAGALVGEDGQARADVGRRGTLKAYQPSASAAARRRAASLLPPTTTGSRPPRSGLGLTRIASKRVNSPDTEAEPPG